MRGGVTARAALRLGAGSPERRWPGQLGAAGPGWPWPCPAPCGLLRSARLFAASLELVGEALEPCVNSLPRPPLPPRAALGGSVGGRWGVISAICSTNQEFRKGNHTKCIYYFKIRFFISFFPAESQSTFFFFLREHCLILYFFFYLHKNTLFFLLVINFPLQ